MVSSQACGGLLWAGSDCGLQFDLRSLMKVRSLMEGREEQSQNKL